MEREMADSRANPLIPTNPAVPLTLEGSAVLHQMLRLRWREWKALPETARRDVAEEAAAWLAGFEQPGDRQSALYSVLGHKADWLLLHFGKSFEDLHAAELGLAALKLFDFLEPSSSFLSVVELSLYESTVKLYASLAERGVAPGSPEWMREAEETLERQRAAMAPRLWPEIPPRRYLCFYPMDRRRGESKNWYEVSLEERRRMMHEHGLVGRKYGEEVRQIITGSIGLDDWEWGVDLFADDPLVFKKLIYEMRFDEVSAVYALFGSFFIGRRVTAAELPALLVSLAPPQ
jgi:chlorite dismutase